MEMLFVEFHLYLKSSDFQVAFTLQGSLV